MCGGSAVCTTRFSNKELYVFGIVNFSTVGGDAESTQIRPQAIWELAAAGKVW
jgi:hypothetical protein